MHWWCLKMTMKLMRNPSDEHVWKSFDNFSMSRIWWWKTNKNMQNFYPKAQCAWLHQKHTRKSACQEMPETRSIIAVSFEIFQVLSTQCGAFKPPVFEYSAVKWWLKAHCVLGSGSRLQCSRGQKVFTPQFRAILWPWFEVHLAENICLGRTRQRIMLWWIWTKITSPFHWF